MPQPLRTVVPQELRVAQDSEPPPQSARIHATLDWMPHYDHLDTIADHALAWEEKLLRERGGAQAVSA